MRDSRRLLFVSAPVLWRWASAVSALVRWAREFEASWSQVEPRASCSRVEQPCLLSSTPELVPLALGRVTPELSQLALALGPETPELSQMSLGPGPVTHPELWLLAQGPEPVASEPGLAASSRASGERNLPSAAAIPVQDRECVPWMTCDSL